MITSASLNDFTSKDLAQMAKKKGVPGWHAMRKAQLVRALTKLARSQKKAKTQKSIASKLTKLRNSSRTKTTKAPASRTSKKADSPISNGQQSKNNGAAKHITAAKPKPKNPRIVREVQMANAIRNQLKCLSSGNGEANGNDHHPPKDRVVLMVRDPFWLHVCWEITRQSVQRARAAMAQQWHAAKPTLRLMEVDTGGANSAERVARDIEIHGGVKNWYVEVQDPPKCYRVSIGYLAPGGKYHMLARSNIVTTPSPGSSDVIDENWTDVAKNYEKIFAQSGGYEKDGGGELQELFEERLRRPMGSPLVTRFGGGAARILNQARGLPFEVDVEMIIFGVTKPDAHVMLAGEPVKLRADGSFTVRMSMPDNRQVLPVVASSADGVEQRTIVLAIERNTKTMEPKIRNPHE